MKHVKHVELKTISAFLLIIALFASAQEWPHYLGPNFDLKPELQRFTATSATEVWSTKVTTGMNSLTLADGLLYTMGNTGADEENAQDIVYCLDAETGNVKWTFAYPCELEPRLHPGGPSSTPAIHEGKVYTSSKFGHLFCLDAKTGEKLWEASATHFKPGGAWWGFAGSPTIMGDVVIYNIGDRGLGLNKHTGTVLWESDDTVVAYATPWPVPERVFGTPAVALLTNKDFLVLNPATGADVATYQKQWEEESNCNAVTPYMINDQFYLTHSAHGLARISVNGNNLTQDWLSEQAKYPNEWYAFGTHVIFNNDIYFLTSHRKEGGTGLMRVDAETGARLSFDQTYVFGNLLGVGNSMIMLAENGELIWGDLSADGFKETFRQNILDGLCWSTPVLVNDRLYARDAEGTVVCLQLKK